MPSRRALVNSLATALLASAAIGGLSSADGQLPPPAPPPLTSPTDALPPVVVSKPAPAIPADAPKAVLDRSEHDFGVSKQEAELKTEFRLTNEGKSPLTLELRADCGCAAGIADVSATFETETLL